jgi:hypothetical protein
MLNKYHHLLKVNKIGVAKSLFLELKATFDQSRLMSHLFYIPLKWVSTKPFDGGFQEAKKDKHTF